MAHRAYVQKHICWLPKLSLILGLTLVFGRNGTEGIQSFIRPIDCGPPNVFPDLCVHGNFTINFNPEYCAPRTLCYKGLGEACQLYGEANDCKPGLYCSCDHCSHQLSLCSNLPKLSTWAEFVKRLQPNLPEYIF
ncbi:uncharacterized protein [Eurosta solidaginis]|uniref:uncharacterized protein n=1 Tax=Eurosta solidaginis TaxID=178769 RepID=UPI0035310334